MAAWTWGSGAAGAMTALSQINFSGSQKAMMLELWSGESLAYWNKTDVFAGMIPKQYVVRGGQSVVFPFTGQLNAVNRTQGQSYTVNADGGSALTISPRRIKRAVFLDDKPLGNHVLVEITDELRAMDGAMARLKAFGGQIEGIRHGINLRVLSTLIQTATCPDSLLGVGIDTKVNAGALAGFSVNSSTLVNDGIVGLNNVPNLLKSGAAAEAAFTAARNYFDALHIPATVAFCDPRIPRLIAAHQGSPSVVFTGGTGAFATPYPAGNAMDRRFGSTAGDVNARWIPDLAGFRIIPMPYLMRLGDKMSSFFSPASAEPTDVVDKKYMPSDPAADLTVADLARIGYAAPLPSGVVIATNSSASGTEPTDWDTTADRKAKVFYNGCSIIFCTMEAIGKAIGYELDVDLDFERGVRSWSNIAETYCGFGALWPEGVCVAGTWDTVQKGKVVP